MTSTGTCSGASSADVSEFTDVALSFFYMLTDQATEMVTIRTFSNQKPWVDRTIRAAVNQRTAAYNAGLLSGSWSSHSEAMLQASLDDVDWDMFRGEFS